MDGRSSLKAWIRAIRPPSSTRAYLLPRTPSPPRGKRSVPGLRRPRRICRMASYLDRRFPGLEDQARKDHRRRQRPCRHSRAPGRQGQGKRCCRRGPVRHRPHAQGRPGHRAAELHRPRRGPRSRGAVGVGDVAGERGDRPPLRRGHEHARPLDELPPALLELIDPAVELDLSRNVFNPDIYRGHSGVERWRNAVIDVWESFHGELEELIDAGDKVVSRG